MADAPRVLIFLLSGVWKGVARLPKALAHAGFQVATLSPAGSYLSQTRYAHRHVLLPSGVNPVEFLVRVLGEAQPDLIIPGCDTTVMFLQKFEQACREAPQNKKLTAMLDLVRRSLGNPAFYPAVAKKKHPPRRSTRSGNLRAGLHRSEFLARRAAFR